MKRYCLETKKIEEFERYGLWLDGHVAYSKITINEKGKKMIEKKNEGVYYQSRSVDGHLIMRRF